MIVKDDFINLFSGLSVHERLRSMKSFYERIDEELNAFCESNGISCLEGCGKCCEHYRPILTIAEAEYMACYLIQENRVEEFMGRIASSSDGASCPMYNEEGSYHCSIYPARSLICRLFGAAPTLMKTGALALPSCKWNDKICKKSPDSGIEANASSQYGMELEMINGASYQVESFEKAVSQAIEKLLMMLEYNHDLAQ